MIKLVDKKDYACTQTNLKFSFDTKLKLKLEILRNSVRKEIREANTQYFKNWFQTSDSGKSWRIINEQLGKQQTNPSSGPKKLYHNNTEYNSDQEIAECFNTYFTSIGSSLASKFKAQVDSASSNIIATNKKVLAFLLVIA